MDLICKREGQRGGGCPRPIPTPSRRSLYVQGMQISMKESLFCKEVFFWGIHQQILNFRQCLNHRVLEEDEQRCEGLSIDDKSCMQDQIRIRKQAIFWMKNIEKLSKITGWWNKHIPKFSTLLSFSSPAIAVLRIWNFGTAFTGRPFFSPIHTIYSVGQSLLQSHSCQVYLVIVSKVPPIPSL